VNHGPLDLFSAFPFENYLGKLKKLIRSPKKPLAQIVKRISGLHFNIPQRRFIVGFQHWRLLNTASERG
jgi:hypothetical protein